MNQMQLIRRIVLGVILAVVSVAAASAQYSVYAVSGDVSASRSGKPIDLSVGATLQANDLINIASGAKIDILNESNNTIFSSVKSGQYSVSKIIIDARMQASDQRGAVLDNIQLGNSRGSRKTVYSQIGHVTREMANIKDFVEPEKIDVAILAAEVSSLMGGGIPSEQFADVEPINSQEGGLVGYTVKADDKPVYVNVIEVDGGVASVSILGQRNGCYELLPGQSLSRSFADPADAIDGPHYVIVSVSPFDVNELVDALNANITPADATHILIKNIN